MTVSSSLPPEPSALGPRGRRSSADPSTSLGHISSSAITLACSVAALLHVGFLAFFAYYDVTPMVVYNIASIGLFLACVAFVVKTQRTAVAIVASTVEVIVHQGLADYFLGWGYGFEFFLLLVPGYAFLGSFRSRRVPWVLAITSVATLVWLFLFGQYLRPEHVAIPETVKTLVNTINLLGTGAVVIILSVQYSDAARRNERRLLEAQERAERASEAKSKFLATVSHEFRTPMNAIVGFTNLALRKSNESDAATVYLQRIKAASRNLIGLINDILDFSKIEAGRLEIVRENYDLASLVRETAEIFSSAIARKGLALCVSIDEDLPREVRGDPMRIQQVLSNLIGNAIKFTSTGEISVELTCKPGEPNVAQFSVRDTGVGIDAAALHQLFEPFAQADHTIQRRYGGTGLGLSICRRLVALMGGQMHASSQVGVGSVFSFELPLQIGERRVVGDTPRILVVEARGDERRLLMRILSTFGFDVRAASDPDAACNLAAEATQFRPDLVIADGSLERGAEVPFTERLAKCYAERDVHPQFILLTSEGQRSAGLGAPEGSRMLLKPVTPSTLLDAVTMSLGRRFDLGSRNASESLETALEGATVLVVDDVEMNRVLAEEMLREVGAEVVLAPGAREAIAAIEDREFDAVLMDVNMPEMDGYQATREIRQLGYADLPIIAMTAHALDGDRRRSLHAGMNDHLTKPISIDALVASLRLWVGSPGYNVKRVAVAQQWRPITPVSSIASRPARADGDDLDLRAAFDVDQALRRVNGNRGLLAKLAVDFAHRYRASAEELRAVLQAGRSDEARALAHALKGAAANLSANRICAAAAALESSIRSGAGLGVLDDELDELEDALAQVEPQTSDQPVDIDAVLAEVAALGDDAPPTLLLVDDVPSNLEILREILKDEYRLLAATTGAQALELARLHSPDLILLDVSMPGIDGYEVCEQLRNDPSTRGLPVIFVSALAETDDEARGFEVGGLDYLAKPLRPLIVRARVRNQIQLKRHADALAALSLTDGLTGVSNRRRFDEELRRRWNRCAARETALSVIIVDIDHFKRLNDGAGHQEGDRVLRLVANTIAARIRPHGICSRYGGEEFACILEGIDAVDAEDLAHAIVDAVREAGLPHPDSPLGDTVTISAGVATMLPTATSTPELVVEQADAALYTSKRRGRNCVSAANLRKTVRL